MSNKQDRDLKELKNLLDPKYARNFWRNIGNAIASRPAPPPIASCDRNGNPTVDSMTEQEAYRALANDLKILQQNRNEPTYIEMIMASQMIVARTNPAAATFVRDTLGAKPVDESKIDQTINEYAGLTDEELETIAKMRSKTSKHAKVPSHFGIKDITPADEVREVRAIHAVCAVCGHEQWVGGDVTMALEHYACARCGKMSTLQEYYDRDTVGPNE